MSYPVRVWDLPTRIFHWVLAAAVVGLIVSGLVGGAAMNWHFRLGYLVLALILFRLVWGLVGGRWSRFSSFVFAPSSIVRHLRGQGDPDHGLGHSPVGALSVFGLLLVLAVQVATGLASDDAITFTGPLAPLLPGAVVDLASSYHKDVGKVIVIALVVLHVLAIVFYRVRKQQKLTAAMVTGDKLWPTAQPSSRDDALSRLFALVVFALCVGAAGWVWSLGN